jgi:hypothetical protein
LKKEYKPSIIIVVMLGIKEYVKDAIILSGLRTVKYYSIPFAGNGNQNRYKAELSMILQELQNEKILS